MQNLKKMWLLGCFLITLLGLAACGQATSAPSTSSTSRPSSQQAIKVQASNGEVTLTQEPQRIVVFDMGAADTLRALGYAERIVGMPTANLPQYLSEFSKRTSVGNAKEPDLEAIAELNPDLIIASGRTQAYLSQFEEIAPTLYFETDTANYWASVKTNIVSLASMFGASAVEEAEKQLAQLEQSIAEVKAANQDTQKTTLLLMLNEGNMAAQSSQGRYSFLYQDLGFQPTSLKIEASDSQRRRTSEGQGSGQGGTANPHGESLSFESIGQINPSQIFVINRTLAIGGDNSSNATLLDNALVLGTDAGQAEAIVDLTADVWYLSGGGLESTQMMVADVEAYAGK